MLFDKLENWKNYEKMFSDKISNALRWLEENANEILLDGKYDISPNDFSIVQKYCTKEESESEYENHKKYIDIQFIISGEEWIYHNTVNNLKRTKEYSNSDDIEFFQKLDDMKNSTKLVMKANSFVILWPGECHMPCISPDRKEQVKKIVVKLLNL